VLGERPPALVGERRATEDFRHGGIDGDVRVIGLAPPKERIHHAPPRMAQVETRALPGAKGGIGAAHRRQRTTFALPRRLPATPKQWRRRLPQGREGRCREGGRLLQVAIHLRGCSGKARRAVALQRDRELRPRRQVHREGRAARDLMGAGRDGVERHDPTGATRHRAPVDMAAQSQGELLGSPARWTSGSGNWFGRARIWWSRPHRPMSRR
jgi:hypothetical protein